MIKLKIVNCLENYDWYYDKPNYEDYSMEEVIVCDLKKIENGRIYEFDNLKEVKEFLNSLKIHFSEEYTKHFGEWDWEELDIKLDIGTEENNLLIYEIDAHPEWRG